MTNTLYAKLLLRIAITGVIVLGLLASPLGRIIDKGLTEHFRAMNERRMAHRLSWLDGVECRVLYASIATLGRVVSPEGGAVLWQYLYGEGQDLWLDNGYLRRSPVIVKCLKSLRLGESKQFALRHQRDDMRLSYALNPFSLRRDKNGVLLYQRIAFKDDKTTYTMLSYGLGGVALPDGLIHAVQPVPYTVYSRWTP